MRKRLAVLAALLIMLGSACLLVGCSFNDSPATADSNAPAHARFRQELPETPVPEPTPEPSPRAVVPALAFDGEVPTVSLSTTTVSQGGAMLVAATGGSTGAVTVLGRTVPMQLAGNLLVAFVGFGTQDPPGRHAVSFDILAPTGEWDYVLSYVTVVATQWTVDYIIIPPAPPPDPNAPPPPPPPPDEGPLLPGIYAGITGKKWTDGWSAPLAGELDITGRFGEQRSFNGGPVQGHHGGTDFGAQMGTPIHSTNHGVVVMSGLYRIRGHIVVVDHGLGVFSLYGHMSERAVEVGDAVARGEVLGYVGSTGLSTGAHLHWEVSVFGVLVDGLKWLDGTQGF